MSYIINPFDLSQITEQKLLADGLIVDASEYKSWGSTLFPESMRDKTSTLSYDKDRIITYIDDAIYADYGMTVLEKLDDYVTINNGTGKLFVRSKVIGDYDNSVKRYKNLDKPVSYNKDGDIQSFLNLPAILPSELIEVSRATVFNPNSALLASRKKSMEEKLFGQDLIHRHINTPKLTGVFKNNDKTTVKAVFDWAKQQGIKYIYSINERRPNVISDNYVLNVVYYTVTGSK